MIESHLIGGKQVGTNFFVNHSDHLGSIQAVTDAAGVEVRRQDHTPFGDQHYATGSHAESKGWIGEREEQTELVYLNARYYDPEIGRFTAPDPVVRLGQGLNRFSYSWNNPVNFIDPTGVEGEDPFPDCTQQNLGGCPGLIPTVHGRFPDTALPGPPRNASLDFFTDAREDLKALAEQHAEALAALRTMLDNTLFAVKAAATKVTNTKNDGTTTDGTAGTGNQAGDGGGGIITPAGQPDPKEVAKATVRPGDLPFWRNVGQRISVANTFIPGILAPTGMNLVLHPMTGTSVSATLYATEGLPTAFAWARGGFGAMQIGGAAFTGTEAAILAGANAGATFVFVGAAWELGIGAGAIVGAAADELGLAIADQLYPPP